MVFKVAKNTKMKVGLVSRDKDLVEEHLQRIRKILASKMCRRVFPHLRPDHQRSLVSHGEWSKEKLYLLGEEEPAFERYTLLGAGEGHRLDMIWVDDGVTREGMSSEAERVRVSEALFETWENRVTDKGIMINTCNCWSNKDAAHKMMESKSYSTLKIGYNGVESMFYEIVNPPPGMTEGRFDMPLWKQWPRERLIRKRNSPGGSYARGFELKTSDPVGSLWKRAQIEEFRVGTPPEMVLIYVALDPATTSREKSNNIGIVIMGLGSDGHLYCLGDETMKGHPKEWGLAVAAAYATYKADKVIYESNQGGDMVAMTVAVADPFIPVEGVHAARGKRIRAEPIAALAAKGMMHVVGFQPELEDELCGWVPGHDSPDRLDALVHGATALLGFEGGVETVEEAPRDDFNYLGGWEEEYGVA